MRVKIEDGFRLVMPVEVREHLQIGEEVSVTQDRSGRIIIVSPLHILERLQETHGLWSGRVDVPDDSVAYMDAIRQGSRLDEIG